MTQVIYEKSGHTAIITFNKPENLNALSSDFIHQIHLALDMAQYDEDVYTIIFTGKGRAFIAGADIHEIYTLDRQEISEWAAKGGNLNLRIEEMDKPTIAAINGFALGGGLELAMACDMRIAVPAVKVGLVETGIGLMCGSGGTQRLPRIVGMSRAKELIFTARKISAEEALGIGLVDKVVPEEELMDVAKDLALAIEKNSQVAIGLSKAAIRHSDVSSLQEGTLRERELFEQCFDYQDHKIGITGFMNKERNIKFKNK